MKIAIPTYQGVISPLFDVARELMLVDVEKGQVIDSHDVFLEKSDPDSNTQQVISLGVDAVICGAISSPLESVLLAAGINVISRTCGSVEEVLHAFVVGRLDEDLFVMPGCQRQRQKRRRRQCRFSKSDKCD